MAFCRLRLADVSLERLAHALDQPFIPWKRLIVGFSVTQYLFESYLSLRQYKVLQATKPPKSLEGTVSQEDYDKSQVRDLFIQSFSAGDS
jgi:STE24 endopeptidase